MFLYAYAKAVNKGYIEKGYWQVVDKILAGLQKKLLVLNADGLCDLHQCNAVAGLGGSGNRDGSFEYYVNERIRSNDIKATAPLIMGLMEMDK